MTSIPNNSLYDLSPSQTAKIVACDPCDELERLMALGFLPGNSITMICKRQYNVVVECLGARFALRRTLAEKILIRGESLE